MPYETPSGGSRFAPSDDLPQHLQHRPVYALPYEPFDGPYRHSSPGDEEPSTDMRFISVGLAQYQPGHVSVKALRHSGRKWTRQSEELPPHRLIDMVHFLALALFESEGGRIEIPAGTFEGQDEPLTVIREDREEHEDLLYRTFLHHPKHLPRIIERLRSLLATLERLKERGDI